MLNCLNSALAKFYRLSEWDALFDEVRLTVPQDQTVTLTMTSGSGTFTGTGLQVKVFDGHFVTINGVEYNVAWIKDGSTGYLTTPFQSSGGDYSATFSARNIPLPQSVGKIHRMSTDGNLTIPLTQNYKYDSHIDFGYRNGNAFRVEAPREVKGVATATSSSGKGTRVIKVYMSYVVGLNEPVSRESALSPPETFKLSDTQVLNFTARTTINSKGMYTRYYFQNADLLVDRPCRLPDAADTFAPDNATTITPDLSVTNINSLVQTASLRPYVDSNGTWETIRLSPHVDVSKPLRISYYRRAPVLRGQWDGVEVPYDCEDAIAYIAASEYCVLSRKEDVVPFAQQANSIIAGLRSTRTKVPTVFPSPLQARMAGNNWRY
jgi:hypothetical protein